MRENTIGLWRCKILGLEEARERPDIHQPCLPWQHQMYCSRCTLRNTTCISVATFAIIQQTRIVMQNTNCYIVINCASTQPAVLQQHLPCCSCTSCVAASSSYSIINSVSPYQPRPRVPHLRPAGRGGRSSTQTPASYGNVDDSERASCSRISSSSSSCTSISVSPVAAAAAAVPPSPNLL